MKIFWKLLLIAVVILSLTAGWQWWNRPHRVDMADYVPADSIIYIEANSLPEVINGITSTDAWRALAPQAGIKTNFNKISKLSKFASWTGIGSADAVVLARAQVAITVLDFDATEETATTLKIMPRAALVAETHTGEERARAAVEKLVGDFARRVYGSPRIERRETNGITFSEWTAPTDPRRKIIATVSGSVAVIGNDSVAVEACLAAQRGERPTLMNNPQLGQMRGRISASDALAFGFLPSGSTAKLLEIAVLPYVAQASSNPRAQSVAASLLPQLANKIFDNAGWSAHVSNGKIEDRYFLALRNGLASRLSAAVVASDQLTRPASKLLPADTFQMSQYNYREPEIAWRGLNAAISSQLDALSAPFVTILLDEALRPYGIETPREFLRAAGPDMATARLDDAGSSTVLIVGVRDREALRQQIRKRLGGGVQTTRIGDAEMLSAAKSERGVAAFVDEHLILGRAESVRRCLDARASGNTLATTTNFMQAISFAAADPPTSVMTFSDDRESVRKFISYFAGTQETRAKSVGDEALEQAIGQHANATTMTGLTKDGFARRTYSSFGQFGNLVTQFAPGGTSQED